MPRHFSTDLDNMPDLVQYLINNISDLPQASHSFLYALRVLIFSNLVSAVVLLASGADDTRVRDFYMNLLVDPIQQRFNPVFRSGDLTSQEMDRICDAVEVITHTIAKLISDVGGNFPFISVKHIAHDFPICPQILTTYFISIGTC